MARAGDRPLAQVASSLGISESCLWNSVERADIVASVREGLTGAERSEMVELRRKARLETENEVLRKAASPRSTSPHAAPTPRRESMPSCVSAWESGRAGKRVARLMRSAHLQGAFRRRHRLHAP
ncbi:hypothetical protein [Nocardia tenerifensis]|uniref:hypothetical protein n=1 Tax=Nocardia tenerifensis TaxID=228006 RepID=UPI0011B60D0D